MLSKNWHKFFRLLRISAGVLLLILGVIGLFLPILQGILFLVLGAALLGKDTAPGRWIDEKVKWVARKAKSRIRKEEEV
ncbi:MAG: hypothetical protein V3U73_05805 [bacterium]